MANNKTYSAKNISVLEGLDAIRKRYSMYVGGKDTAPFHLFKEVVDNSVDEYLNGYADLIEVHYNSNENRVTVIDNGRGMPIDDMKVKGKIKSALEVLFTELHAGGKFNKDSFKTSAGMNGVGLKAVSALSSNLKVTSYKAKGYYWDNASAEGKIEFSKGKIISPFEIKNLKKGSHGTIVSFIPDESIFEEYAKLDVEEMMKNLEMRTYCNAGLKISFTVDDGKKISKLFYHENGIKDYMELLVEKSLCDPLYFNFTDHYHIEDEDEKGNIIDLDNEYEIIMQYGNTDKENIICFVNGINASGVAITGFRQAITQSFNNFMKENNLYTKEIKTVDGEDIRKGLYCIINILHGNAFYKSQTKDELSNPEVRGVVQKATNEALKEWFEKDKTKAKELANRMIKFAKGRENAKKYSEKVINETDKLGLNHSKKYYDCATNDPDKKRLYIVEGDSAANLVVTCRDPEYMAVLSTKGKPLNIFGCDNKRIIQNEEQSELCLSLFGTNNINKFDINNILTKNIMIMSDADIDGYHIRGLHFSNLWRLCPDIIKKGYVYIVLTPKYRTVINGKNVFFNDDKELCDYRYNMVKKDIKLINSPYKLKYLLNIEDDFMNECKRIISEFNIHEDIFDTVLAYIDDTVGKESFEILKEYLDYHYEEEVGDIFSGLYNDETWHYFNYDDLLTEIEIMCDNFNIRHPLLTLSIKDSEEEMTVYELFKYIRKNYKLKLFYQKGLGELDPDELKPFMRPESEIILQMKCENEEEMNDMLYKLFGPKPELRKQFILDGIKEGMSE